jgi:16S rRNA (guanine966-N2)-methyltransferase
MRACYHLRRKGFVTKPRTDAPPGRLRIVAGTLRGSRLVVPDAPGLRPTPDRVRETLFNWLAPVIAGAHCLDLFAGTGALGIEALSRGAAAVDFVEADAPLARLLRENLERLKQSAGRVIHGDALRFLAETHARYDVVFLDPPFSAGLWDAAAQALETHGCLRESWIYVEAPLDASVHVPANWTLHRDGHAGAVRYELYRRSAKL